MLAAAPVGVPELEDIRKPHFHYLKDPPVALEDAWTAARLSASFLMERKQTEKKKVEMHYTCCTIGRCLGVATCGPLKLACKRHLLETEIGLRLQRGPLRSRVGWASAALFSFL